jgi:hypothetical protein
MNFTMVIRLDKSDMTEEVANDIRQRGIYLRLNMRNRVIPGEDIRDAGDFFIIVLRDELVNNFRVQLLTTPFDRF